MVEEPPVEEEPPTEEEPPATEDPVVENPDLVFIGDELTPGNEVTVQGSGFPPGYVFLSSQDLEVFGEAFVDESGVMESWFWIPADASPGDYVLTVTSEGDGSAGPWEYAFTVEG